MSQRTALIDGHHHDPGSHEAKGQREAPVVAGETAEVRAALVEVRLSEPSLEVSDEQSDRRERRQRTESAQHVGAGSAALW